tara:strand:+ start:116 stop:262 length:147 start_codon:yes stop_codon:yes gene_type:complete
MRSRNVMVNIMKDKKWIVSGYYLDGHDIWTLLISTDDRTKTKRVKGML